MFEKMSEILGFAVLEKSTNVRLQTIRKEDMEIKKKIFYFILLYNTVLVLPYIDMNPPRVYMCKRPIDRNF